MIDLLDKLINKIFSNKKDQGLSSRSLDSFFTFFDVSPVAKVLLNKDGIVLRSNKAFIKLIGGKKYIESGWLFGQLLKKSQQEIFNLNFKRVVNDIGDNKPLEIKIASKHNMVVLMFITKFVVNNESYFVIHLIDITERKKLEINFSHAQKMQALGQLAGGISHDFNNLLTAMLGFSDLLLLKHHEGDSSYADIVQIKQNIQRAINLVKQLLAFSKKQDLNIQIINVNEVLFELAHLINHLIDDNITLEMKYDKNLKEVRFDQGQLEQVIINLVINARDAMSNGGTLAITTENITEQEYKKYYQELNTPCLNDSHSENEYVLITVADNGTGIPKKLISKIFEPFFSTKKIGAGTGLGLSIVYGIIKQAGGSIFLKTEENIGSKFYIVLKAYNKNYETLYVEKEGDKLHVDTEEFLSKETILIVEDEESVREVSAQALKNKGYNVLKADNSMGALNLIENLEYSIDLVITDVVMPKIDGAELTKKIQEIRPNTKIIFMSGYVEHPLINIISANSNVHFIAKPFSISELTSKVKEVLLN